MAFVACPSCGEKGSIPNLLIGKRIKCQKCGKSFQAVPSIGGAPVAASAPAPAAVVSSQAARGASIDVDGLDASNWSATSVATVEVEHHHEQDHEADGFTASPQAPPHVEAQPRQYKVLCQKDKFFEGKFDLARLEDALNHYARQGWAVRAMSTPHVMGFSGGPREEIVVLLER